jgi:hypothetical protein
VEHRTWYDEEGEEQEAGGYDRRSRGYVTPRVGRRVRITDMVTVYRPAHAMQKPSLPEAKL